MLGYNFWRLNVSERIQVFAGFRVASLAQVGRTDPQLNSNLRRHIVLTASVF